MASPSHASSVGSQKWPSMTPPSGSIPEQGEERRRVRQQNCTAPLRAPAKEVPTDVQPDARETPVHRAEWHGTAARLQRAHLRPYGAVA
jgi:hypothetical protein